MTNPDVLSEAKRLANETTQLVERLESETDSTSEVRPAPTAYSSSVSSTEVDPISGDIKLTVTLYPGDAPIEPIPTDEPTPGQVPATTVPPTEGAVVSDATVNDTAEPGTPVGQVPAE